MSIITKHTATEKRNVVNHIFSLVRSGSSITNARKVISKEVGVTSTTLTNWQTRLKMKTPNIIKAKDLVANNGVRSATKTLTTSSNKTVEGLENMKGRLGVVFESLVQQDGQFTNYDASSISGVASVILGSCKQILLERKAMSKLK